MKSKPKGWRGDSRGHRIAALKGVKGKGKIRGGWKKKVVHNFSGYKRYEFVKGEYTIDINIGKIQGHAGSNSVSVYGGSKYGGWLLGTPKHFHTISEVNKFVEGAKKMLDKGYEGKRVPFPG